MPSKKVYLTLIIIMVVFGLVMFLAFGVGNIRQENLESTIIVGDNTTWTYQKMKWVYVRKSSMIDQLNWTKFHVYENDFEVGNYYLWHDDKWYFFDEKKQAKSFNGKLFAYSSNYVMEPLSFQEEEVTDYASVYHVLQENGFSTSSQLSSLYKVSLDYDGDKEKEDFYIVSNAFPFDFEADVTFSFAYMVDDGEIYMLYQDISQNNGYNGCKPFYHSFVDTNSDGTYEIILSCGRYSADDQVDMLYQFQKGEFKLLISNQ